MGLRSRSELVDFLSLIFGVGIDAGAACRSTAEMATILGIPEPLVQAIEANGMFRPVDTAEGRIHGAEDLRMAAVVASCFALGAGPEDLATFGAEAQARCDRCTLARCPAPCDNTAALRALLARLVERHPGEEAPQVLTRVRLTRAMASIDKLADLV